MFVFNEVTAQDNGLPTAGILAADPAGIYGGYLSEWRETDRDTKQIQIKYYKFHHADHLIPKIYICDVKKGKKNSIQFYDYNLYLTIILQLANIIKVFVYLFNISLVTDWSYNQKC